MTQRALCLNNSSARDRLTLGVYYRVVSVRGGYIVVIDDKWERTMFWAERFEPLKAREEAKERT